MFSYWARTPSLVGMGRGREEAEELGQRLGHGWRPLTKELAAKVKGTVGPPAELSTAIMGRTLPAVMAHNSIGVFHWLCAKVPAIQVQNFPENNSSPKNTRKSWKRQRIQQFFPWTAPDPVYFDEMYGLSQDLKAQGGRVLNSGAGKCCYCKLNIWDQVWCIPFRGSLLSLPLGISQVAFYCHFMDCTRKLAWFSGTGKKMRHQVAEFLPKLG